MSLRTHYDNLQVSRSASEAVIKAAYRSLSQRYHPDKNPTDRSEAERVMKIINEAYEVLSDPHRRAEHDAWIDETEANVSTAAVSNAPESVASYDLVIPSSGATAFWYFTGCVVFVLVAVSLNWKASPAFANGPVGFVSHYFFLYVVAPTFGAGAIFWLLRLINPSPSIVVNEHGVHIAMPGGATLRWTDIEEMRIATYEKQRFLLFTLANAVEVMERQSAWGRWRTESTASWAGAPSIAVPASLIGMPLEELLDELHAHRPSTRRVG